MVRAFAPGGATSTANGAPHDTGGEGVVLVSSFGCCAEFVSAEFVCAEFVCNSAGVRLAGRGPTDALADPVKPGPATVEIRATMQAADHGPPDAIKLILLFRRSPRRRKRHRDLAHWAHCQKALLRRTLLPGLGRSQVRRLALATTRASLLQA